jgi:hypothetical protein
MARVNAALLRSAILNSSPVTLKFGLFTNAHQHLRMFRNCIEVPHQSFGRGIIASGNKRAVFDILVSYERVLINYFIIRHEEERSWCHFPLL